MLRCLSVLSVSLAFIYLDILILFMKTYHLYISNPLALCALVYTLVCLQRTPRPMCNHEPMLTYSYVCSVPISLYVALGLCAHVCNIRLCNICNIRLCVSVGVCDLHLGLQCVLPVRAECNVQYSLIIGTRAVCLMFVMCLYMCINVCSVPLYIPAVCTKLTHFELVIDVAIERAQQMPLH